MCGVLSFLYSREGAASRSPEQRASQVPRSTSLRRRQPRLVYQLSILLKPLQAGEVHVQRKEAGVAGHAVHRALVAMPYVGTGRSERLCGSAASEAGATLAGRWLRGRRVRLCGGHEASPFVVRASGDKSPNFPPGPFILSAPTF